MATKLVLVAAIGLLSPVFGQVYRCEGLRRPDYDECDWIVRDWEDGIDYIDNNCDNDWCRIITRADNSGNCAIGVCFKTDECIGAYKPSLYTVYNTRIKHYCEPQDAGGVVPFDEYDFEAFNNPDYTGSRGALEASSSTHRMLNDELEEWSMTRDAFDKLFNVTSEDQPEASKRHSPQERRPVVRKSAAHPRQEDGDSFTLLEVQQNVARGNTRHQASGILSPGVSQTWSFSETISHSVSTSVSVGVSIFEIFTAEAGIEVTQEHSETVEEGLEFTVGNCPNEGVVYYVPLWDYYMGYWSSDPDTDFEVWIPVGQGDYMSGRFVTECLG